MPNNEVSSFHPSRIIRECLSWKLATEFMRRHPEYGTLIEAHPGGGQYDCLAFYSEGKMSLAINRVGSITLLEDTSMAQIDFTQVWQRGLEEDGIKRILDEMSELVRIPIPKPLPSTTREALTCRIITVIMCAMIFDKRVWQCLNGQEDTSGYGDQGKRDKWFDQFPAAGEQRRKFETENSMELPRYHFWFIHRDQKPITCLSKKAFWYPQDGSSEDLMKQYRQGASVESLAAKILATL